MRTTKWLWRALGVISTTISLGPPAVACSCVTSVDPAEFLREADLVFEGEVTSIEEADGVQRAVTLHVTEPLKGKLGQSVTLDQERMGMCAEVFEAKEKVRVVAYGSAEEGYGTDGCSSYFMTSWDLSEEIYLLAGSNRQRTLALTGSDKLPRNEGQLRALLRWLAEYRAIEEGLDAAADLLVLVPADREARLAKAQLLSELRRDAESLLIAQVLVAHDPADQAAQHQRVFSLARLKRGPEIPADWRDFATLQASGLDLRRRDLTGATLKDAVLFEADFSHANLAGADLGGAQITYSDFSGATLAGANFFDAYLSGSKFHGANLRNALMASTGLDETSFTDADLRGAILAYSYLDGDLSGTDMRAADLRQVAIGEGADLDDADLRGADLRGAMIRSASVSGANLTGAVYNDDTIFPEGFDPVAAGAVHAEE